MTVLQWFGCQRRKYRWMTISTVSNRNLTLWLKKSTHCERRGTNTRENVFCNLIHYRGISLSFCSWFTSGRAEKHSPKQCLSALRRWTLGSASRCTIKAQNLPRKAINHFSTLVPIQTKAICRSEPSPLLRYFSNTCHLSSSRNTRSLCCLWERPFTDLPLLYISITPHPLFRQLKFSVDGDCLAAAARAKLFIYDLKTYWYRFSYK